MDIVKILAYGVIGLGFLLAYLSFMLLQREQNKEEPKESILKTIRQFMLFSLALSLLGLLSQIRPISNRPKVPTIEKEKIEESKDYFFLGRWRGEGFDLVNEAPGDTTEEKYAYKFLNWEFTVSSHNEILLTGEYQPEPKTNTTEKVSLRRITGKCFKDGDFLKIIYTVSSADSPNGRSFGVFLIKFLPSGRKARGYFISKSILDGEFVTGSLKLVKDM